MGNISFVIWTNKRYEKGSGEEELVKKTIPSDNSPIHFRIASGTSLAGTVSVTVQNQSWPIFVCPDVYLDIQHISSVKLIESKNSGVCNKVELGFNSSGCNRLSALSEDINVSVVLFINNYALLNINVTEKLCSAQ